MKKENQSDWLENILEIPAETQTIEFKRLSEDKVVAKIVETVVAMTNTDGGVIILGIDDPEKTKLKGFNRIYGIDENIPIYDALGRELQRIIPPFPIYGRLLFSMRLVAKRGLPCYLYRRR